MFINSTTELETSHAKEVRILDAGRIQRSSGIVL